MANLGFFPLAAIQVNLRRLLIIRSIVLFFQVFALVYAFFFLKLELHYGVIGSVLGFIVLVNLLVITRLKKPWPVTELEYFCHLLFDVGSLSFLLYLSGGANNPFISYFLVPVTIAASILAWRYTWLIALVSLISYTLLLFFYQPVSILMPSEMVMDEASHVLSLHIIGMWFNFLVSAALITFFVVKMASEIRLQRDRISRYREDNLRDEQILALATQAAGTAHEIGTPLGTVSVLLKEMERDCADNTELANNITLLQIQIARCKKSMQELVRKADFRNGGGQGKDADYVPLKQVLTQLLDQWQLIRPEVKLELEMDHVDENLEVKFETVLQQALVNILNNAADESPQGVQLSLYQEGNFWGLRIRDYGEGIGQELSEQLGTTPLSTKEEGLGIGMMLSQATINRHGGTIKISAHEEQGTNIEIQLPLDGEVNDS